MTDSHNAEQISEANGKPSRVRSNVFVSYSHADTDNDWYADVLEYLQQLTVGGEIDVWDDHVLQPGDDWEAKIEEKLGSAIAAVFLVTPTFVTSEYITQKEVPRLLERLENEGLIVHALLAQHCDWEGHPIADFMRSRQLAQSPGRPLEEMEKTERHKCLNNLVRKIRRDIGVHRNRNGTERRDRNVDELEDRLGIELLGEIAGGDTSIIYRGRQGARDLAVKAMVVHPISDRGKEDLRAELRKSRALQSPVFIRILDLKFDALFDGHCVAVADWVPGRSLKRVIETYGDQVHGQRWMEFTASIIHKLADALDEAHDKKLCYLNINPSDVFLHRGEPKLYPIDFSSWMAAAAHAEGALAFAIEMLAYVAPEHIHKPAGRGNFSTSEAKRIKASRKADQYALGMVALSMLEGGLPFEIRSVGHVAQLLEFQKDPRTFKPEGETRLDAHPWCRAVPGFARVLWRMLEPDPDDRWRDMSEVASQLRVIVNSHTGAAGYVSHAKQHYVETLKGNDAFYRTFYETLFGLSDDFAPMFAKTDMARQRVLLDGAFERILNYRANQDEPTTLTDIASHHKNHPDFDLSPDHCEMFGKAFIKTLRKAVGVDRATRDAWEAVLWPSMEYMKEHATASENEPRPRKTRAKKAKKKSRPKARARTTRRRGAAES